MTTIEETAVDQAAVEEFAGRMFEVVNHGFVSLLCSIGHRTGLFDTLALVGPATSAELAAAAGLEERYVREWLGGTACAGIVEHDGQDATFRLPAAHAACLTTAAGPEDLSRLAQFVPLMARVEDRVVRCFQEGGGLSYADYPRFHALMAEDSAAVADALLVDAVLPLVDGLTERLRAGIDVADVGCGSGHAVNVLARTFPASRFVGLDREEEAVAAGRAEAAAWGLANARFEVADAARWDEPAAYDLVTAFDAVHDQAEPARVLAAVAGALRPGGTFVMVDARASSELADNLDLPHGPFLYGVSLLHCLPVSLGLGGAGLGTAWGEQRALAMLAEAGLGEVEVKQVEGDWFNSYYVARHARA